MCGIAEAKRPMNIYVGGAVGVVQCVLLFSMRALWRLLEKVCLCRGKRSLGIYVGSLLVDVPTRFAQLD